MPRLRISASSSLRVDGERDHAVDVGRREPGVDDRGAARLGRELHLAATRLLRELGRADPGDDRVRSPTDLRRSDHEERRARAAVIAELDDDGEVVVGTVVGRVEQVRDQSGPLLELDQDHDARRVVGTVGMERRDPGDDPAATGRLLRRPTPATRTCRTSVPAGGAGRRTPRSAG